MPPRLTLVGKKFGRWTVISFWTVSSGNSYWYCKCSCGNTKVIQGGSLRQGDSTSCGCLPKEKPNAKVHGEARKTAEYNIWSGMKARCYNAKGHKFHLYGGRGIKVCRRWLKSYSAFLLDMGRRPGPEYSIDRINNDGNYEPSNCRWATAKQQRQNQRKAV